MRVHTGLVDQSALSSKPPKEVMAEVLKVLQGMGMDIKKENEFRLRCTRVRRKKAGAVTGLGLGSVMSPLYGEHSVDAGDEVKFVIELCRIKNLPGLYLLNIKRLRGSVWSFKFIYQTVLE
ncbi:hypothetical protein BCR39DRAFT_467332 [Naematelia encephala]|uniref:non-specific serine/threonine protein kinase n=1 Tax=Naematelia encephala TaxID=71784 RepID=A0A1Y2B403_9TREE|nr:hypothetical protein BCR39DRAFT_467332 [Naematelia encephala]